MDSGLFIDNVKVEKANAMMKYNRLKKIADLFRFFEICVVLILLSWFSTRVPVTFRVLSDYFRHICVVVVSPCFVFLLGNVIVLTLFLKSGQFGQSSTGISSGTDLYDEFVKNSCNRDKIRSDISSSVPEINISPPISEVITVEEKEISSPAPEIVVYEDKQIQSEEQTITDNIDTTKHQKIYRRTQSENLKQHEKPKRDLRRTKTEKRRRERKE
ncbi:tRNA-methyltransferase non-catalytic subunit trm6MTase subunit [Thalictrum thalictroides]|uniref:tRNA-methyltransferase non-catalytic subunit trm6MTase subunit n=1 Tax=Thalictrum thalictroides TaxID=46969 RepID=A0A7J6WFQ5_THATH|nr:tRNA-methyltransferase non-catalytic subunit trm6MTase subunit [Thalictrum thalictroides]